MFINIKLIVIKILSIVVKMLLNVFVSVAVWRALKLTIIFPTFH